MSTAEQTKDFIRTHPHIRTCLQKDLINYSALARHIADKKNMSNKTSKEAILVAARRYSDKLHDDHETQIRELLQQSELIIRNGIDAHIYERPIQTKKFISIQQQAHREDRPFYLLQGTNNVTIINHEAYSEELQAKRSVEEKHTGLALITIRTSRAIESTPGVISYLTTLFAEHDVNIIELVSCWTDTVIAIRKDDVNTALSFLQW